MPYQSSPVMVSLEMLKWTEPWLTHRTQQVVLDSMSSTPVTVEPRVPQDTL